MSYKKIGSQLRFKKVMEKMLKRPLRFGEVIHHINLDKTNDDLTNLLLCEVNGIHISIHKQLNKLLYHFGKELLKKKIISFDRNNCIYYILDDINQITITNIANKINLKEEEINQIIQRRKKIIEKAKEPKISFWDTIEGKRALKQIEEIDEKTDREWQREEDEEMLKSMYKIKKK